MKKIIVLKKTQKINLKNIKIVFSMKEINVLKKRPKK